MLCYFFRRRDLLLMGQGYRAWLRVRVIGMGSVFDPELVGCVRSIWLRKVAFAHWGCFWVGVSLLIVISSKGWFVDDRSPRLLNLFILHSKACLKMFVLGIIGGTYLSGAKFFLQRWQRLGRRLAGKLSAGRLFACLVLSILKQN